MNNLMACVRAGARNLLLGANVASLRFLRSPLQAYRYWSASLFLRDSFAGRGLPEKNICEAFPNFPANPLLQFPAPSQAWPWKDPSYLADLVHLGLLCNAIHPRTIFEIGTSTGYSSLFLAANCPPGVQVWTLDLPSANETTRHNLTAMDKKIVEDCHLTDPLFVRHGGEYQIERLYGDSAGFDFSPYYQSVDLFFVDGAHTYKYVKLDTISALRCCHRGSVIAWHDYGRSGLSIGVTRWLHELRKIAPVYSTPGSSLAFLWCDEEPGLLLKKLGHEVPATQSKSRHAHVLEPRIVASSLNHL